MAGDVVQVALDIPPWIQAGIDDGSLFRVGSVVRRVAGGSIAKHLDEIPRAEQVVQEAARRAIRADLKIVAPVLVVTAIGAGATLVLRRRKNAERHNERADVPQCVDDFEASLRTYVEAGRSGKLDADVVDRLIVNLEPVKAWTDSGNTVTFSFEQLEPLFRLVIEHTTTLARAYSVPLTDIEPQMPDGDAGVVTQLRRHLEVQKQILGAAA